MAANRHAEDRAGVLAQLLLAARELHAARLAASADQHLGLHDHRKAKAGRRRDRILDAARGHPATDRKPVACEKLLALILQEIHPRRETLLQSLVARGDPRG